MEHLIGMTSVTYANKAQRLLRTHGIQSRVVPTPKNIGSGCGYSLALSADTGMVTELLRKNGIKYKEVY